MIELMFNNPMLTSVGLITSVIFSGLTYKGLSADDSMSLENRIYGSSCLAQLAVAITLVSLTSLSGQMLVTYVILLSSPPFVIFYLFLGGSKAKDMKENVEERKELMSQMRD